VIPSVVLTAALDRRLWHVDLKLYLFLCTQLDVMAYRPVKLSWLARRMGQKRQAVQRSLRALVRMGYLERGPFSGKLGTYRLVANIAAADASAIAPQRPA
jgi:DNA-binding IclR family transcriptional regulator